MSLSNYLDENDVVGSIRLQLNHPSEANKIWVIVEGEHDQRLFSKLIDGDHVEIESAHGGITALLKTVSELLNETERIIGIRDADFCHLNQENIPLNIFLTDYHDVEMMITQCDAAFHSVEKEYFKQKKDKKNVRNIILNSIAFIGALRWLNNIENLELNFNKLGFGAFYNGESLALDETECLSEISHRSPNKRKVVSINEIKALQSSIKDLPNLCNGHDFQKAFALYVTANSKNGVSDEEIGRAFRIAYRTEDFKQTQLFQQLYIWAQNLGRSLFR